MTDLFFTKAQEVNTTQQKAVTDGRKLGTLQDHGIFLGPDAPAHLKNKLYPMETPAEWESRVERQMRDPLIQKLGPGATISAIYRSPELRAKLTTAEIEELWERYFRSYPDRDVTPWPYPDMVAEAKARRTNRKLANGGGLLK